MQCHHQCKCGSEHYHEIKNESAPLDEYFKPCPRHAESQKLNKESPRGKKRLDRISTEGGRAYSEETPGFIFGDRTLEHSLKVAFEAVDAKLEMQVLQFGNY